MDIYPFYSFPFFFFMGCRRCVYASSLGVGMRYEGVLWYLGFGGEKVEVALEFWEMVLFLYER